MPFYTIIYASNKVGINEFKNIVKEITCMYGKDFVKKSETGEKYIHEIIKQNINLIIPEDGWKVVKLIEISKEIGIAYSPSEKSINVNAII